MKSRSWFHKLGYSIVVFGILANRSSGQEQGSPRAHEMDIAVFDRALAEAKLDDPWVRFGDVGVKYADLKNCRDRLAGLPHVVTPPGTAFKWPGGNVNYRFDPAQVGNGTITSAKMQQFRDGIAEWAAFANLHFIEFTGTPPANYITVQENSSGGEGGFSSSVGMAGGEQFVQFGPMSWTRGTVCHEVGHALGLWHEQQRPDRDTYVVINWANIDPSLQPNFAIISGGQTFATSYDFYSVMHYSRTDLSNNGQDTISMQPAYAQYIDVIGKVFDRILSKSERAGMAAIYGNPSPLPSALVTNTRDSGPGSLRTAIYFAFDRSTEVPAVPTTVTFQVPTTDPNYSSGTGVFTIKPTYIMPALGDGTTVDGVSQAAFTGDTNPNGPEIVLDGANFAPANLSGPGLILRAANCTVKGLGLRNFSERGIDLLQGNDPNGSAATGNVIGGTTAAARNIISGNVAYGIGIRGSTTSGNVIQGNYIGTDQDGSAAQANSAGVVIYSGAHDNTIGGAAAGARNIISGNTFQAIYIGDAGTNNNLVQGNYIGLDVSGTTAIPNGLGIDILSGAQSNKVGGTSIAARNVISGNNGPGVLIHAGQDPAMIGTRDNVVQGNYVGLTAAGSAALANQGSGVQVFEGAPSNTIGGTAAGSGNVISGNLYNGIDLSDSGTINTFVQGNIIGLNPAGAAKIPNGATGIQISNGAQSNTIGGTTPAARNLISGNNAQGIAILGSGTSQNIVSGNYIGVDVNGASTLVGNGSAGISIFFGAQANTIGGSTSGARNIISGNFYQGITIDGSGTNLNAIQGNYIGLGASGNVAVPNGNSGISIYNGAQSNTVGGTAAGMRNVISGNTFQGLVLGDPGTSGNLIQGNYFGLDAAGLTKIGNTSTGIDLFNGTHDNVIGGTAPGSGNFICGSTYSGVAISQTGTTANLVQGNTIGLSVTGAPIGNGIGFPGVLVYDGAQSNAIGGQSAGAGNIIASNTGPGVALADAMTIRNVINRNSIFSNGQIGIDLSYDGVTPNDSCDADAGPNNLQNFPILTSAIYSGGNVTISGTLNSAASKTFRVEFFSSAVCDPSGNGEGQNFIGAASVTTAANCAASFGPLVFALPFGHTTVSATATDPDGNSSEFSVCIPVVGAPTPTPSPTPTPIPTATPSPTPTATPVPTSTPTPTPPPTVSISGAISYCSNPSPGPVANAALTLTGSSSGTVASDVSGNYTFSSLSSGGSYIVTPAKGALVPGSTGINTIDVVATQRHFLNIAVLPPGCRLTAADVNGDTAINTIDVVAIQRFFLGQTTGTANVGKFRFNPTSRAYPGISSDQTGQNYDALVFGDVASPFADRPAAPSSEGPNEPNRESP